MQALGLHWADAKPPRELAEALILAQKPNGGWAQRADFLSDAYATGEVLYALNQGCGIPITHPVFRRGMEYLLGTQYKDGSWYVRSRSVKFQPYFDSGFPFEHDQWISAAGTAWAALALSLAIAVRTEWTLFPVLPAVLPCFHFGYGYGFLRGILDFVLLNNAPQTQFVQLTREHCAKPGNVRP